MSLRFFFVFYSGEGGSLCLTIGMCWCTVKEQGKLDGKPGGPKSDKQEYGSEVAAAIIWDE
ncbi:MAG: hypothetical protein OEW15_01780 [Nitrospirota bacterium]|nr:hypothetical protein [Nitrospirota bacterium]